MNSFNHYAYGSVGEFLYRVIGGIDVCEDAPGYKQILIRPCPGGELTWAETSVITPYGEVCAAWRIEDAAFSLEATIPCNTSAKITLPDGSEYNTGSGRYAFTCSF